MVHDANPLSALAERLRSPVTGTFLLSWLIYNWRICLILFSSGYDANYKIEWILGSVCTSGWNVFLVPLLFSIAYLLVMPHIRKWNESYVYKRKIETDAKNFISDQNLNDLKTYRQTLVNITADLIRTLEQAKQSSDQMVENLNTCSKRGFTQEDIQEITHSIEEISRLSDKKLQAFKHLFELKYTALTVEDQIDNLKYALDTRTERKANIFDLFSTKK